MLSFETYQFLAAERRREAEQEAAHARLARTAEAGGPVTRSGSLNADLGEAVPWWAVLRVLRRRARPPVPRGNPDGCADQA